MAGQHGADLSLVLEDEQPKACFSGEIVLSSSNVSFFPVFESALGIAASADLRILVFSSVGEENFFAMFHGLYSS